MGTSLQVLWEKYNQNQNLNLQTDPNINFLTPHTEANSNFKLKRRGYTLYIPTPCRFLCGTEYIHKGKRLFSSKVCKLNSIENQTKGYTIVHLSLEQETRKKIFHFRFCKGVLTMAVCTHHGYSNRANLITFD